MKKIILHIGAEKTGTTSLQTFLAKNQELLSNQGIYVPGFLGKWNNHRKLTVLAFNPERIDDFIVAEGLTDPSSRMKAVEKWTQDLHRISEETQEPKWIASSEQMQSRLTTHEEVSRLKSILTRSFAEVEVLLYIRNPIDAAVSLWSTLVKCGHYLPEFPAPSNWRIQNNCNYKTIIQRWQAVFGDNLKVRLFTKSELHEGDLIKDFCRACGIEDNSTFIIPPRENETLSHEAIRILSKLNKAIPYITDKKVNPTRGDLDRLVAKHFNSFPRYVPSKEQAALYAAHYEISNEWVRSNIFPDRKTLFDEERHVTDQAKDTHADREMTEDAILEILQFVWKRSGSSS